ncbi:hypothetical protein ASG90_06635 [Nocardioides sp. Soil797]|nr:hypothetical protein ASG90_06635 [Nocardioides sp. Soil797]
MNQSPDDDRRPFWTVFSIFDPEGEGSDFAYTAGLAERGLPELHMWSRPSLGSDPGDDWKFSRSDNCRILNELAWRLLDGKLEVGDTWSQQYDDGLVTAHFRVDPDQEAEDLDAFQAAEGARVLPVRWSLEREPIGPSAPMSGAALAASAAEFSLLRSALSGRDRVPTGWELPQEPDWSPGARFGPRTPNVLACASLVWTAEPEVMIDILYNLLQVDIDGSLTWPTSVAIAKARPMGRVEELHRLGAATHEAASEFGISWGHEACAAVLEWLQIEPAEEAQPLRNVRRVLGDGLVSFLSTSALADGLELSAQAAGVGPVLCALAGHGVAPGPEWLAADHVLDVLSVLASTMSVDALARASLGWAHARERSAVTSSLQRHVDARSVTSASFPPLAEEWLSLPKALELQQRLRPEPLALVQEWAVVVTTVLTRRGEFTTEQIDEFVRASGNPSGLAQALNEPIAVTRSA